MKDAFASHVADRIVELAEREGLTHAHAWPRVAADLLGYDSDEIDFFQGNDCGIDFFIEGNSVYELFQAKMHELGDFGELDLRTSFDDSGILDLAKARDFLLGGRPSPPNVDPILLGLRERLKDDLKMLGESTDVDTIAGVTVIFHLVTLGDDLTPRAERAVRDLRSTLVKFETKNPGVDVPFHHQNLETISRFFEEEATEKRPDKIRLRVASEHLKFDDPADVTIRTDKFVTFYGPASDLVAAAKAHGPRLFDANVRYELKRSSINEIIAASAQREKSIKLFHLYNNGVTIAAERWAFKKNGAEIEIYEPSVINGCQTVRSLVEAETRLADQGDEGAARLGQFEKSCSVLIRLVRNSAVQIDDIVRAANTQNTMEPRNLLSNQREQRRLESEFAAVGWFYERKDGALGALRESKRSALGVPLSKFRIKKGSHGPTKIRSISNPEIAASWLSFIGYSDEGKNKRKQHFKEGKTGLYSRIFKQVPTEHRRAAELDGRDQPPFEVGRPPATWLISAQLLFRMIKHLLPSPQKMRSEVRSQLREDGKQGTLVEVNQAIMDGDELRMGYALSMVDHVLMELVGFALMRACGSAWMAPGPARQLLGKGTMLKWFEYGEPPAHLPKGGLLTLDAKAVEGDPGLILIRFAAYAIERTLSDPIRQDAFIHSERKSRYMQGEGLLKEYPKTMDRYDTFLAQPDQFTTWWAGGSVYSAIGDLLDV